MGISLEVAFFALFFLHFFYIFFCIFELRSLRGQVASPPPCCRWLFIGPKIHTFYSTIIIFLESFSPLKKHTLPKLMDAEIFPKLWRFQFLTSSPSFVILSLFCCCLHIVGFLFLFFFCFYVFFVCFYYFVLYVCFAYFFF